MYLVLFERKSRGWEALLSAKIQYFFGKIMVPEFTCGKVMLPFRSQLVDFGDWFTGKPRQTYASRPGNLMGLVTCCNLYFRPSLGHTIQTYLVLSQVIAS